MNENIKIHLQVITHTISIYQSKYTYNFKKPVYINRNSIKDPQNYKKL